MPVDWVASLHYYETPLWLKLCDVLIIFHAILLQLHLYLYTLRCTLTATSYAIVSVVKSLSFFSLLSVVKRGWTNREIHCRRTGRRRSYIADGDWCHSWCGKRRAAERVGLIWPFGMGWSLLRFYSLFRFALPLRTDDNPLRCMCC